MIFEREIIIKMIDEFNELYKSRPIKNNEFGMRSPQLFGLFCYLKIRKPKLIIESGVYQGQGTWLIKQVLPDCTLICIEPNLRGISYVHKDASYYDKDVTLIDLESVVEKFDSDDILVFFDDHQNFDSRIDFLIKNNFQHILFEDNYPPYIGDCISPKKVIEKSQEIDYEKLNKYIQHYEEFPPIYKTELTGWYDDASKYNYVESLCSEPLRYSELWAEREHYYWICYVKIKKMI